MGFESLFGFRKKKTNEEESVAQEISPERMAEMLASEEEYLKNNPGPAVFKGSEDLDTDPNTIEWQDPDTLPDPDQGQGFNRSDVHSQNERTRHLPKID